MQFQFKFMSHIPRWVSHRHHNVISTAEGPTGNMVVTVTMIVWVSAPASGISGDDDHRYRHRIGWICWVIVAAPKALEIFGVLGHTVTVSPPPPYYSLICNTVVTHLTRPLT